MKSLVWHGAMVLALVCVSASQVRAGANPDAVAALNRGLAALDKNDPRTARVELMNAIKADPALASARVAQARAMLMLGNGASAQDELDRAISLGAQPSRIRHLLAQAALLRGQAQDAVKQAEAKDIDPRQAVFAARIAGQGYQALGQYPAAARAFDRALTLAPKDPATWADLGRFRIATGDMAAAVAAADRAVSFAPANIDALLLRALLVREQYGLVAALPWFERALSVRPDDVPTMIEYAATLSDAGQARRALGLTRRALALSPGLPRAYLVQAIMAARAGQYDLARSLLVHTNGALDGQAATRLLRGVLHMQAGNATLAIDQFAPLLEAQPLNLRARLLLARAYYLDGQYADAERVIFPLVERADADSYALVLAARIHEAMGGQGAGSAFLSRANRAARGPSDVFKGAGDPAMIARDALARPDEAAPNLRYIRALLEAGQGQAALLRATALARANPGAPDAQVALGDCLSGAGRYAEAAHAYERAGNLRFNESVALRIVAAWQRAGQTDNAQRALTLFITQNPNSIEGNRLAATLWLAAGEYDRAIAILERLRVRIGNEDAALMSDLAHAWIGKNDGDKALGFAAHAYRLAPGSAVASDIFGWALFKAGDAPQAALDLLGKAAELAPHEPLVQWHLGQVYAATGNKQAARVALGYAARAQGFPRQAEAIAALAKL
jgi:tetratricopeptide (TPR) repeat protein